MGQPDTSHAVHNSKHRPKPRRSIRLIGVRQNNLKNLTVEFPWRKLSVVTGLSGSGKSSLAFQTLYSEGQRRYVESLSTYTRQFLQKMPRPEIDGVENIPPAIALEQHNHVFNSRSTVGTQTEIVDYLRLLFSKLGSVSCVACGAKVKDLGTQQIATAAKAWLAGRAAWIAAPLPSGSPQELKKLLLEKGFTRILVDGEAVDLADLPSGALPKGVLEVVIDRLKFKDGMESRLSESIEQAAAIGKGKVHLREYQKDEQKHFQVGFACSSCGTPHSRPEPHLFSFNHPLGACPTCSGFGFTLDLDEALVVPDPTKTLKNGAIDPLSKPSFDDWQRDFFRFVEKSGVSVGTRYNELKPSQKDMIWEWVRERFSELARWKYKLHIRVFIRRYQKQTLCRTCKGTRLRAEASAVRVSKTSLPEVLNLSVGEALEWCEGLKLSTSEQGLAKDLRANLIRRLTLLSDVGLAYLTLSRAAKTLSGGEFQRINLATQLGHGLCGTLYVLDEPSIGLHPSDTSRLLGVLEQLRSQGNTVVLVEHDLEVIQRADWLLELGPAAGRHGGSLMYSGTPADLAASQVDSPTARALRAPIAPKLSRRGTPHKWLEVTGCRENNLKDLDVKIPLERLVVVTGVSGSGKSSLVHKTLYPALQRVFEPDQVTEPTAYRRLHGMEHLRGVIHLDQKPIGRSSRSNPATYLKIWEEIRRVLAHQVLAMRRGITPQHFSFNVDGGRCPVCSGEGEVSFDMHFMAEVKLPCEECNGKRFKASVLEIEFRGKNAHDILELTIDEARDLFQGHPTIVRKLEILRSVGLGYLRLGQSGTTLSGGESQRLKIAAALERGDRQKFVYLFDEPTTGLHTQDVLHLLTVLQDLVDEKNSVILVEHNVDVWLAADWMIDLGPGGGEQGGRVVAEGPPRSIAQTETATGRILSRYIEPGRTES